MNKVAYKSVLFSLIETPKHPCFPNPCGINALCNMHPNIEHAATCVCKKGYFGDPSSYCHPECTENEHCSSNRVCKNQKCVDTCPGFCGTNTVCSISNHLRSCDCRKGYTGNPSGSCKSDCCKLSKIFKREKASACASSDRFCPVCLSVSP